MADTTNRSLIAAARDALAGRDTLTADEAAAARTSAGLPAKDDSEIHPYATRYASWTAAQDPDGSRRAAQVIDAARLTGIEAEQRTRRTARRTPAEVVHGGELWQDCRDCGALPTCAGCHRCSTHCEGASR